MDEKHNSSQSQTRRRSNSRRLRQRSPTRRSRRRKSSNRQKKPIYCGNNKLHPDLLDHSKVIGTRHGCLRKGFGVGYYVLPTDSEMLGAYQAIDQRKIWCGNDDRLPEGYAFIGTNHMCYVKGVGAGKKKKATEAKKNARRSVRRSVRRRPSQRIPQEEKTGMRALPPSPRNSPRRKKG